MLSRAFDDSFREIIAHYQKLSSMVVMLSRAFDDSFTYLMRLRFVSDEIGGNALTSVR